MSNTDLIALATPAIQTLITSFIKPKFDILEKKANLTYDKLLIPKSEHFGEYLHRSYKKYSIVNTLVFRSSQMLLKDIYIPLTLKIDNKNESILIDKYPALKFGTFKKILITDTAGMGKSTLSKMMFLDVIDQKLGIPIFIELRRLSKDWKLLDEIQLQISSLKKDFDHTLMLELINMGGFIFFLDGYDEIALTETTLVTRDIKDFISKSGDNIFILTSRPEESLSGFGDFQSMRIAELRQKEAFELLRKYDKQGKISSHLIDKLKTNKEYQPVFEFLKNPLLVSLMFAAFDYKQTIPLKKHLFYRQVYDAYFECHDLSKGDGFIHEKKSGLLTDDFDRILRHIGFSCLKYQKIEFSKDDLLKIIDEAQKFCSTLEFKASSFLDDLLNSVPLFCEEGSLYKWVHKSLQEYFAASFIFKDLDGNKDRILNQIYISDNIGKYYNLLDIYYDVDPFGFRKNFLLPFLKDFKEYFEGDKVEVGNQIRKIMLYNQDLYFYLLDSRINILDDGADFLEKLKLDFERSYKKKIQSMHVCNSREIQYVICSLNTRISNYDVILRLLVNKQNNDLVTTKSFKSNMGNILKNLQKNVFYPIDIKTESILNQQEIRESVNAILCRFLSSNHFNTIYYLNYKKLDSEIIKIEEEIKYRENPLGLFGEF